MSETTTATRSTRPDTPERTPGAAAEVAPDEVLPVLARHLLVDGLDLVVDLDASRGSRLVDARTGTGYLDLFTFFASNALGMNHPRLHRRDVEAALLRAARHKPSNSDVYTADQARFVATFERVLGIDGLPHLFLIEGGGMAVENVIKAAMDWKSQRNEAAGGDPEANLEVLHLTGAFHGRTGYTMSLTNTDPSKVSRFAKFDWPRIPTPVLRFPLDEHEDANRADEDAALSAARDELARRPDRIAAVLVEPIQGEGGDRHLSARFLSGLQELAHDHDALFAVDEVQTGVGLTGTAWAHQQLDVTPDLVAFGKKTHVCGVMAGRRLDEVERNVFRTSSRLNSTFGGSLVDMVRATAVLEVIEEDGLVQRAGELGAHLLRRLHELARRHDEVTQVRGRGLMCAFDLPTPARRDAVLGALFTREHVVLLGCGTRSIRFRPALTVTTDELDAGIDALDRVLGDR